MEKNAINTSFQTIEEFRKQDNGPDLSNGDLVSELWSVDEDGTPYVHRVYKKAIDDLSDVAPVSLPGAILRGVTDYGAIGYVWVSGHFTWDSKAKKTYVTELSGDFKNEGGVSSITDRKKSSSGNGTERATATFTCKIERNLGGSKNCKASVWCEYTGRNNGV